MFSRRKKRHSVRRNLFVLAAMFLGMGVLAAGVRLFKLEPVLILSEDRTEIAAKRKSPDNAFHTLEEAFALIPRKQVPGGFIKLEDPDQRGVSKVFEAEDGSMAKFLGIQRPDDHPDLLDFLRLTEPATQKAREALAKPYCLALEPVTIFDFYRRRITYFALVKYLIAQGNAAWRFEQNPGKALDLFVNSVRLSCFMPTHPMDLGEISDILPMAYKIVREMAAADIPGNLLDSLQSRLVALGTPFMDRERFLIASWRMLDDTQMLPVPEPKQRFPENVFTRFFLWNLRKDAKKILENKDQAMQLLKMNPVALDKWATQNDMNAQDRSMSVFSGLRNSVGYILNAVCTMEQQYKATLLVIAIERYRRENGVLPETLETLAPVYLEKIPPDPVNDEPFQYKRYPEEGRYTLCGTQFYNLFRGGGIRPCHEYFQPGKYMTKK